MAKPKKEEDKMTMITLFVPKQVLAKLNNLVNNHVAGDRSELIRQLILHGILDLEKVFPHISDHKDN